MYLSGARRVRGYWCWVQLVINEPYRGDQTQPTTSAFAVVLWASAACATPRRAPLAPIVSLATSQECALSVKDADVSDWRVVRAARFSFCVPQSWTLDGRYQQFVAPLRSQQLDEPSWKPAQRRDRVSSFSWAAPDTLQRVTVYVWPEAEVARLEMDAQRSCLQSTFTSGEIDGTPVCVSYGPRGCARTPILSVQVGWCVGTVARAQVGRGSEFSVLYPALGVSVISTGLADARAVAATVRATAESAR